MESEDFAYPSNLASGPLHLDDEDDYRDPEHEYKQNIVAAAKSARSLPTPLDTSFSPPTQSREGSSTKASLEATPESNHWDDQIDRGHFRANNVSTGSDLVQVTVEDLLISEEQVRTIKASNSYKKKPEVQSIQEQFFDQDPGCKVAEPQVAEPLSSTSLPPSSPTSPTSPRSITITATLRGAEDSHLKRLSFETEGAPMNSLDQAKNTRMSTKPKAVAVTTTKSAPKALTPAQQREVEADANIQKAIELHENNQLVEATRYFRLAAQSENPLGQLMYGLSLRHGWVRIQKKAKKLYQEHVSVSFNNKLYFGHIGLSTESNRGNHLPSACCRVCDGRTERTESTTTTTTTTGGTNQCRCRLREPAFRPLSTTRTEATTGEQIKSHELASDGQSGQEASDGHGTQGAGHGPVRARHVLPQRLGRTQGQAGRIYLFQDCCRSGKFYLCSGDKMKKNPKH